MNKFKWLLVAGSLVLMQALCLAGCSKIDTPEVTYQEPKDLKNRILRFQLTNEPEYLDPGLASGVPETAVLNSLFSGLVQHPVQDGDVIPEMATHWDISKDGKVYTFYLRKGAKWSDGNPVTAHDFVYSWKRVLNPATGAKYAFAMYPIKNGRAYNAGKIKDPKKLGLKAINNETFQVTLESPTPYFIDFLWYTAFKPVPSWALEKHGARWTTPENIVTNGPFLLKRWTPYKEILVLKNPDYYEADKVKLVGVNFNPIENKETALKLYDAGDLDVVWEAPALKASALMSRPDFVKTPYLGSYFYRLQVEKPPLNDKRVRQALALAINRDDLCKKYLQDTYIASSSIVPEGLKGYIPAKGPGFDPERAKKLLKEAGFEDPTKFPVLTIHYNTDDRHKLVAQVIQQMWRKNLGIHVELWNEEWKSYLKTQNMENFQISRSGWIGDYADPNTFLDLWTSDSTSSHTGWKNSKYDALVLKANQEINSQKRMSYLQEAENILLEESPLIPLYTYTKMYLIKPYVKGYYPTMQDIHPQKWIYMESEKSSAAIATTADKK